MENSAKKANDVYQEGFRLFFEQEQKLKRLQEEISLQQIQLSKKTTAEKLQDTVSYYNDLQGQYKKDSEEYLRLEKKKLDTQIKLEKEQEAVRLRKRKAAIEQAVRSEKEEKQRKEEIQKRWDKRRTSREQEESNKRKRIEETEIQNSIDKFKREVAKHKEAEKQKTATERKEARERTNEQKKRDFGGGFGGQLTPRSIGGALGSLTKYLGLYQAINAAQRLFRELTLGSVREAIAFEKSLANLGAVAGATSEEVATLSRNALSVAGATKFTADEIVGLQTELSKLGFSADEVVNSTRAIAFAAQALGSPLAATAEQVGKVINQFDLLTEQAGFVGDVLVTAINSSALSFDSFGTAIQYVGPIAKNLGLSLEQTAGAMAVLADNGFTASRVGTGLRGIFTELGKTSADVEVSLKSLAEQNISLSEAVDLVGKRNAAQLITLLDNIDAIEEGNEKYYQQGRAVESAAKQVNTFSGQMEILTSNFKELQIEIGNSVVKTDFLLRALDAIFPKGAKTARAFQAINEIGFDAFDEGIENVSNGADSLSEALRLLNITEDEYKETLEKVGSELAYVSRNARSTQIEVEGLSDELSKNAEERRKQAIITEGQTEANNEYEKSVRRLTNAFEDQVNVNAEVDAVAERINAQLSEYNSIIETGTKNETDAFGVKTQMVAVTEDEILKYKGLVAALQGYLDQLTNITFNEDDLAKKREADKKKSIRDERDRIKERIKALNEETALLVEDINERAKQQTAVSKNASEEAEIEAQRQLAVSNAYKATTFAIADINVVYQQNKKLVEDAIKANEKLSEVLGSEIINDLNNSFKNYSDELKTLKKSLEDGTLDQKGYELAVSSLRGQLVNTISTFKVFAGTSTELDEFFEKLLSNFDASAEAKAEERKLIQDLIEQRKKETEELIADINEQAKQRAANAEGAEAQAAVEAQRQADVSKAYEETAKTIAGINVTYEENKDVIEDAVKSNEKLSKVLGSEVINDVNKAFGEYSSELLDLQKAQKDGTLEQEDYERAVGVLRTGLLETINTFRTLTDTSPELEKFFDGLVEDFDGLTFAVDKNKKKVDEGKDNWDDFTEDFLDTEWAEIAKQAVNALANSLDAFNDTALENTKNRLSQELDAIANRYQTEEDILKSQLNNQLITESQYRKKQKDLRKAQIAEENAINRQIFEAEKKQDRNDAGLEGIEAAAQSYLEAFKNYEPATAFIVGSIGASIALAQSSAQISAINQRKFYEKKFADGGIVNGPSHEQGGVPFTVQGQGGYEMEGGEYIVNKRATLIHRDLLERINKSGRTNPTVGKMKFAEGGLVTSPATESVDYLKAIAEATTSTAIGVSKPVRAYIADKDLRVNANERRIRDRNDRI